MKIINKKAKFRYELLERVETGLVLTGAEVKSVKLGRMSLAEAYVRIQNGEVWLINANIPAYKFADPKNYDPTRTRKLLLHEKEILALTQKMEAKHLVLVPTAAYNRGSKVKLEITLGRPKKLWQKREDIRKKDVARDTERELRKRSQ
ncbi:SsrA-binding protein [Candidatus Beckwithbacteria bacterium RBG_13_42_9]|uniref:SsrA-binding protein n=1 Tax=Candidatus Beckwithbacteria bacterium RBG_13_42_9 TaxID=1797457 RepID=A0A1F5E4I8_9BACT|nr:MAG: SsrA-binding protein [Candidatus Beckwithbacteria bacterium RBG_13_42_9]